VLQAQVRERRGAQQAADLVGTKRRFRTHGITGEWFGRTLF
jgi:hypothetical protein